jgi:hypothetical protein
MATPQGWANLLCFIPRVTPGLLEVNASSIVDACGINFY